MKIPDHRDAALLGSYADRDEYQVGSILVWVRFHAQETRAACTDFALQQLPEVLAALPDAIAMARAFAREQEPEFWRQHEEAGTAGELLSVWGLWIDPVRGLTTYGVQENLDFEVPQDSVLPALPVDWYVAIERDKAGALMVKRS
ncbi:hypothetical protein ACQ859_24645 [Roseateles chitinivorans]|uniref:hypothetical protein n=1 Tax=Roseateles chitinivorans TaxID=2917965 RepID=UPI003D6701C3